jgi:hypothetical protein
MRFEEHPLSDMLFKTCSAAVFGVDVCLAEVDIGPGEPAKLNVVGLPAF